MSSRRQGYPEMVDSPEASQALHRNRPMTSTLIYRGIAYNRPAVDTERANSNRIGVVMQFLGHVYIPQTLRSVARRSQPQTLQYRGLTYLAA